MCRWFFSSVSADFFSMNFQAISISTFEPDSKPWESWKIKLLPRYVIWCSISCRPLYYHCMWIIWYIDSSLFDLPQVMALDDSQTVQADFLQETQQSRQAQNSGWLTNTVIYDGFCPFCYTTNFLKDGCLACISPSNDKDAKVWA